MKGMSLSIETVVIFIIAVVILGILSYFLLSGSESFDIVKLRGETATICGTYAQTDPTCADAEKVKAFQILGTNCEKLGFPSCTGGLSTECIKLCCAVTCP